MYMNHKLFCSDRIQQLPIMKIADMSVPKQDTLVEVERVFYFKQGKARGNASFLFPYIVICGAIRTVYLVSTMLRLTFKLTQSLFHQRQSFTSPFFTAIKQNHNSRIKF
jgi:hypothetical protein